MNPFRRLVPALLALLVILVIGVTGFVLFERRPMLEAVYLVVVTLLTIGFDQVHPVSGSGRVLTIFIAVCGVGTALYAAGQVVEIIIEGEILGYRTKRKMEQRIADMRNHYIICGFGRVGHQVAADFASAGTPYVVIDSKVQTTAELSPRGTPHIVGDATSDEILEEAGISRARGLVACSDSDVANVYVTLSARALNPTLYIVARASQPETEKKLRMAGANRVISPYVMSGRRMAAMVTRPVVSDFLDTVTHGGELEFRLHEMTIPAGSPLAGRTLADAEIRLKSGALVLAIHRADGGFSLQPNAASVLGAGDVLVLVGTQEQIDALERLLS
jgi:voltage-gated potassium channel